MTLNRFLEVYAFNDTHVSQKVDKCGVAIFIPGKNNIINVNRGLSEEDLSKLSKLITPNEALVKQMTETVAKQCGIPATKVAIDNFFKILQKNSVPIENLDSKLREMAHHYKKLMEKTKFLVSEDPEVQKLQQKAIKALKILDFESAGKWLGKAYERDLQAIEAMEVEMQQIQEAIDKRKLSQAITLATLANSKQSQLAYKDSRALYQQAFNLLCGRRWLYSKPINSERELYSEQMDQKWESAIINHYPCDDSDATWTEFFQLYSILKKRTTSK